MELPYFSRAVRGAESAKSSDTANHCGNGHHGPTIMGNRQVVFANPHISFAMGHVETAAA